MWVAIYGYHCDYNGHSIMSTFHPKIRAAGPSSRNFGKSAPLRVGKVGHDAE